MAFYQKYILPRILNVAMQKASMKKERGSVISKASGIVLEIGFGSGLNVPLYKNVEKLYALEPSHELYAYALERIDSAPFPIEYLGASAEQIPLGDNTMDTVVSTWTLCSIPHPELALKEVARVLKPNGTFVFIEHGRSPKSKMIARLQTLFTPLSKRLCGGCHWDREIDKLIEEAGFTFTSLEKFSERSRFLSFTYKGVAMVTKKV